MRAVCHRLLVPCLALLLTGGCSDPGDKPQEAVENHLQQLAQYYGRYTSSHMGRGPANIDALKKYLAAEGVKNVDELLTSPRDKQPYVLVFNVGGGAPSSSGGGPVIAHEQTGVGGKRFVATILGGVEEADEARFQQMIGQK